MNDIPCKCGHKEFSHRRDNEHDMFCNACWDHVNTHGNLTAFQYVYHEYASDNLLFVEQLAKERGLV